MSETDRSTTGARERPRRGESSCAWCGRPIPEGETGRRRSYCRRSCRQRAYEDRQARESAGLAPGSVVLGAQEVEDILDRAFLLRCAAEDLQLAISEGAGADDLAGLAADLVAAARAAERIR